MQLIVRLKLLNLKKQLLSWLLRFKQLAPTESLETFALLRLAEQRGTPCGHILRAAAIVQFALLPQSAFALPKTDRDICTRTLPTRPKPSRWRSLSTPRQPELCDSAVMTGCCQNLRLTASPDACQEVGQLAQAITGLALSCHATSRTCQPIRQTDTKL